ncbi:MAG: ArnT family glycosyltransferase [Thermodesulfobacteriota bacterium]
MVRLSSKIYPQKWIQVLLLIGFCVALYFVNLGRWDLWDPDEPRYAQVAREMVTGGDWILMHYNGKIYPDKPPFFFWAVAVSSFFWQGFHSYAVRFVPALFGTLTVLLTFLFGKALYSSRTGFLSGLILATSIEFAYLSIRANIDTTLTFFTTAALFCFLQWHRYRRPRLGASPGLSAGQEFRPVTLPAEEEEGVKLGPTGHGKQETLLIYGFYASLSLATLTKGPVGFILPLLVVLVYLAVQKDWKSMRQMKLLPGMLLFVGIVLTWYVPAVIKGGEDYLNMTLFRHTIDRFSEGWSKPRPIYYYFYNFPIDFLPWTLFLPAAIAYGYSRERVQERKEFLFITLWFVLIFLFFSLSKGKRALYLLPLYPAASLMVGKLWNDLVSAPMDHFGHAWISIPLYGFIGLTLLAGAAIPLVVSMKLPSYVPYSLPLAFLLVGGGLAIFVLYRFENYGAILCLMVGIVAAGFFYSSRVIFPLINPYKSARFISEEVTSRILPGEKLGVYGRIGASPYNFYTGIVPIIELNTRSELLRFVESPERVFCIIPFNEFSQLQNTEGPPKVQLISRRKTGDKDVALVTNR